MSKQQINFQHKYDRVIALIDMDCFYCQVEEKLDPELTGKPIAVVQYNAWRGGGIIAVNYPARAKGVTRHMRGDEAKEQCPEIALVKVPNIREKADLSKYRDAGKKVAAVLQNFTPLLERASVDEAYLDITEKVQNRLLEMNEGKFALQPDILRNTYALGYTTIGDYIQDISRKIGQNGDADESLDNVPEEDRKAYKKSDIKLLIGSSIVNEIRAAVKSQTGYECSAGIAHNKILAKLVCGMNKPNKQTILPQKHIGRLYGNLPVGKVQGLGGKFGEKLCEDLGIEYMGDLVKFTKEDLQKRYDERNGLWLYNIARGIDLDAVTPRMTSKSIGCCKKFPGRNAITGVSTLNHWLHELAKEICERLEQDELENNRRPKQLVVSYMQTINNNDVSSSRSIYLTIIDEEKMVNDALDTLKRNTEKFLKSADNSQILNNPIKFLGLSVGKFETQESKRNNTIQDMFKKTIDTQIKSATANGETKSERFGDNVRDIAVAKKSIEIQDMFKNTSEWSVQNEDVRKEPSIDDSEKDAIIQKSAEQSTTEQSFFAKLKILKSNAATELVPNYPSTSSEATLNEPIYENDDVNSFPDEVLLEEIAESEQILNRTRAQSPVANISKAADYMQTYAEFYRPPPTLEIPKLKCSQCNKMVNAHEMQIHTDEHFAFQLIQEQRIDFQSQSRNSITAIETPPAAKKVKISKPLTAISSRTTSIDKFLLKKDATQQNESVAGCSSVIDAEMEICTECGKNIPIEDILEHMDYHAAKKLHDELLKSDMTLNRSAMNNTKTKTDTKTGVKGKKDNKKCSNNNKSIASFFQNTQHTKK